jgi:hypothetical protein
MAEIKDFGMVELTNMELDAVGGGGNTLVETNIAVQVALVIGGNGAITQLLGQSNEGFVGGPGAYGSSALAANHHHHHHHHHH